MGQQRGTIIINELFNKDRKSLLTKECVLVTKLN